LDKSIEAIVSAHRGNYRQAKRTVLLRVNDIQKQLSSITMSGKPLLRTTTSKGTGWRFEAKTKMVSISFEDSFNEQKVVISRSLQPDP